MTRRQPDNSKMREILGRELVTLEQGIKNLVLDALRNASEELEDRLEGVFVEKAAA